MVGKPSIIIIKKEFLKEFNPNGNENYLFSVQQANKEGLTYELIFQIETNDKIIYRCSADIETLKTQLEQYLHEKIRVNLEVEEEIKENTLIIIKGEPIIPLKPPKKEKAKVIQLFKNKNS